MSGGDILSFLSGKSGGIYRKDHRDRRLIDCDSREGFYVLEICNRIPDVDPIDPGKGNDIACRGLFDLYSLESLKPIEVSDLGSDQFSSAVGHRYRVSCFQRPGEDPSYREPANIVVIVDVGDQELHRAFFVPLGRWHGMEN